MSTMKRLLPGIGAAAGLLALLVAAPWALFSWGRVGLLAGIDWAHAFTVPDDGRLMLGFLSLIGWVAWLVLAVSIVVEIVEVIDRLRAERTQRPHRPLSLPGLDLPRLIVRGLVVSAVTAVLGLGLPRIAPPAVAQTVAVTAPRDAVPVQAVALDRGPAVVAGAGTMVPSSPIAMEPMPIATLHVVQTQEDVWSLATRYYGDARQWQRIVDANPDLIDQPDDLRVGWRLVIPGVASPDGTTVIIVVRGDSLSKISARYLGDGDRWPEIFALNRDVIENPNLIYRSWRLRIPGAPTVAPAAAKPAAATKVTAPPVVHPVVPDAGSEGVPVPTATPAPTEGSTQTAPARSVPSDVDESPERSLSASQALALGVIGTVGAGLAAAVVRTIRRRRDVQLALRPLNRRILFPPANTMIVESALAVVGLTATPNQEPEQSVDAARSAPYRPRHAIIDNAWATVTAGFTSEGPVSLDLETHRLVTLDLGDEETTWGTACAWALELACGTGAGGDTDGATIVAVGPIGDALAAASLDSIVCIPTARSAIDELVATVAQQRAQLEASGWGLREARLDEDAQGAWWPRVYVFGAIDDESMRRLVWALGGANQTAVSAIIVRDESDGGASTSLGARFTGTAALALLEPDGVTVRPVSLSRVGAAGVVKLLGTSGSDHTVPAPWYDFEGQPDNVLSLLPRLAGSMKEVIDVGDDSPGVTDFSHPTLMLLGPIQLLGAAGPPPVRAERSCIEYCAWMVEHPGATASQMAAALLVAEGTRRSNVSRLRGWLGTAEDDTPYLPEAYTGRLYLDPLVSSDWQRLRALISPGINRVPVPTLVSALKLVRGAPLADAAPGQWHWAEELRADMVCTIRDIGARVGDAALADGDIDLARWAAGRALVAAPGDEILMRLRLRTEHRAGNRPDVERIVLQLTRHARILGIDLDDETVRAIQEAIEGQPRARA
jgi:nucleoid-associated protein YgaU